MKKEEFRTVLENWETATPELKESAGKFIRQQIRSAVTATRNLESLLIVAQAQGHEKVVQDILDSLRDIVPNRLEEIEVYRELFPEREWQSLQDELTATQTHVLALN